MASEVTGCTTPRLTAPGSIWIAGVSSRGPWLLSIDHSGIITEIGATLPPSSAPGPGVATYMLAGLRELHATLDRVYKLAMSLPEAPLDRFKVKTANLPRTTDAERWVIQRIGQDIFRSALLDYWDSRCPLTGITDPGLLRASHIVPWSDCNDEQRLDVHNGLLLSALWDAAFDQGLVSFADDGTPLFGLKLSETARRDFRRRRSVTTLRPPRRASSKPRDASFASWFRELRCYSQDEARKRFRCACRCGRRAK